jgi:hypothetical protein
MLRSTFQHLKGIGAKREQELWRSGIVSWEDFESRQNSQLYSGPLCQDQNPARISKLPPPPRLPGKGSRPFFTEVDLCGCAVVQRLVKALVVIEPTILP